MVWVGLVQPSRLHPTCTARLANQTWLHKLLLRGPKLCWGWISVHLSSPFRLLQPSAGPKLTPAKIYLLCSSRSASTVFPLGCCSIYTLTCLSSDFGSHVFSMWHMLMNRPWFKWKHTHSPGWDTIEMVVIQHSSDMSTHCHCWLNVCNGYLFASRNGIWWSCVI